MKELSLLLVATALGIIAAAVPRASGRAFAKPLPSWQEPQKPEKPDKQLPDPNVQPPPNPAQQNGQQPDQPQAQPPQTGTPQSQSFSGKIVKEKGQFVLKNDSAKTTYMLDNQDKARQFEGKQVMVTGTLDTASNTIHVTDIKPA